MTACSPTNLNFNELPLLSLQAHVLVAQALEAEGNLREAEKHYTDAKDWKAAVQMYRAQGSWEDALRVAKVYGGVQASKQVRALGLL